MAKRVRALVRSKILIWARKSSGFAVEEAAKKISVKPERLVSWESGEDQPTINQLRKIATVYKRPLSVFYLQERPKTFQACLSGYHPHPLYVVCTHFPE